MKIAIIGDASRTMAWENHLRPHNIVQEVILSPSINGIQKADACLLLDDTSQNIEHLLSTIQKGIHTFFISKLPLNVERLERVQRVSREANVQVQFSHWPSLSSATQLMTELIDRPSLINIVREVNHTLIVESSSDFEHLWVDEVGFCLRLMNSGIHHIEAKQVSLENKEPVAMQIFIRFDNGGTASIYINIGATENNHHRFVANHTGIIECDVNKQIIRDGRIGSGNKLFFKKEEFDPSKSAEKAALQFLKAIQLNKEPTFTIHHLLQLARVAKKIDGRLKQF